MSGLLSQDEAFARYQELDDNGKRQLAGLVSQGKTPRQAMTLLHAQDVARTSADAENDLADPSTKDKIAAGALGAADALSMDAGANFAAAPDWLKPLAVTPMGLPAVITVGAARNLMTHGRAGDSGIRDGADEAKKGALGASYGAGHLGGDAVNAATGLAGPATSAATAVEDLAAGAKPADTFMTGLEPLIGKLKSLPAGRISDAAMSKAADVAESLPGIGKIIGAVRKVIAPSEDALPPGIQRLADDIGPVSVSGPAPAPRPPTPTGGVPIKFSPPEWDLNPDLPARTMKVEPAGGRPIKFAPPVEDAAETNKALDDMAESYDPRGENWRTWLTGSPATPESRPELDAAAKILGEKTGANAAPAYKPEGIGTPRTPKPLAKLAEDITASPHPEDYASSRSRALDTLAAQPPESIDMPADVAVGGEPAAPPRQVFQGDVEQMVKQVRALPPAQRTNAIHTIARLFNKRTALNVAKSASVSLALNPL